MDMCNQEGKLSTYLPPHIGYLSQHFLVFTRRILHF